MGGVSEKPVPAPLLEALKRCRMCATVVDANLPPPPDRLVHHSDCGVLYACHAYRGLLAACSITQSMSHDANEFPMDEKSPVP
jgi:hypothetical protein